MSFGFGFGFPRRAAAGGAAPSLNFDFTSLTSLPSRITFSRTSNATLTDSNGRVSYAPHNLLTNSEDFEAAVWTKGGGATIVSNDAVAPDGTTTADRLVVPNSIGVTPRVQQNTNFTVGLLYVNSIYVKKSSYRYAFLYGGGTAMPANVAILDMDTGLFTVNQSNVASVVSVSGGWYRVAFSFTASATAADAVRIGFSDSSSTVTFNGDGVSGGLLWGAQLNVANAPVNLLTFSEQFDNAAWGKNNVSVTANTAVAPDGTTTADKLVSSSGTGQQRIAFDDQATFPANRYTLSVYAKAAEWGFIGVTLYDGATYYGAVFSLTDGTASLVQAGTTTTATSVGNGWWRLSVSALTAGTLAPANDASGFWPRPSIPAGIQTGLTGDGTSGIFIWGAQLNTGSTALPYVATTSSIYLPPSYNSTTPKNLLGYTQEFDNAAWTKSNSFVQTNLVPNSEQFDLWAPTALSVTANNSVAPNGTTTADTITADGTTNRHGVNNTATIASGQPVVFSAYVKAGTNDFVQLATNSTQGNIFANFQLSTATAGTTSASTTSSITSVGNGWYRLTVGFTTISALFSEYHICIVSSNSAPNRESNNLSTTLLIWGAQLVQGSVPGDYQLTTSAAAAVQYSDPNGTRTAELVTATAANAVIGQAWVSVTAPYTFSIWMRRVSGSGTIEINGGASWSTASITSDWQRISITQNVTAGVPSVGIRIGTSGDVIQVWGAQLSNSASVDPYAYNPQAAPTSTAYFGPRFDFNPVTLAANGLLIEQQSTNLMLWSEDLSNAVWSKGGTTVTANATTAPDGLTTADALIENTATSQHQAFQAVTLTAAPYTWSVYAKQGAGNKRWLSMYPQGTGVNAYAIFDVSLGTVTLTGLAQYLSSSITPFGNGWYRCAITFTGAAVSVNHVAYLSDSATVPASGYTGDGASGLFLWGSQVE